MPVIFYIVLIAVFLYSVIIHEISHGVVAGFLGDDTAKLAGRLTLNPLKHLDPIGSVALPLMLILFQSNIIFGWAKPVPVNPINLKDPKYGEAKVSAAGPISNLIVALFFGLILRFVPLGAGEMGANLSLVFAYITWINILLAVFNLIPIPPLDGSHILFAFLPNKYNQIKQSLSQYGFIILLAFLFFLFPIIIPVISFIFTLITGHRFM